MPAPPLPIEIGLTAAIVAVEADEPAILVAGADAEPRAGLPFGPFDPLAHHTFEQGLRAFVAAQTSLSVGYVEQLYTFGDRGRHAQPGDTGAHMVSIGYLALTRVPENALAAAGARLRALVPLLPLGGLARAAPGRARQDHPAPARRLGRKGRQARARPRAIAAASGCTGISASAAPGTRRRCSTATNCSTRPG